MCYFHLLGIRHPRAKAANPTLVTVHRLSCGVELFPGIPEQRCLPAGSYTWIGINVTLLFIVSPEWRRRARPGHLGVYSLILKEVHEPMVTKLPNESCDRESLSLIPTSGKEAWGQSEAVRASAPSAGTYWGQRIRWPLLLSYPVYSVLILHRLSLSSSNARNHLLLSWRFPVRL